MSECETCNNAYVGISLVDGVCRECRLENENGELKTEVRALKEFRNACVSLTGSLWPQNETTEYLSTLLQAEKG